MTILRGWRAFAEALKGCQVSRVSTSKAARMALIDEEPFDLVCLDHDLGEFGAVSPGDGMEVAQFITRDMRDKIPRWVLVHSCNVPADDRMERELEGCGIIWQAGGRGLWLVDHRGDALQQLWFVRGSLSCVSAIRRGCWPI